METTVIDVEESMGRPIDRGVVLTNINAYLNDPATVDPDVARLLLADAAALLEAKLKEQEMRKITDHDRPPSDSSLASSELDYQKSTLSGIEHRERR